MVESKEKVLNPVDPDRPKKDWGSNGCPLFIFGDDDAAEYDMKKMKKFFSRFKRKGKK